MKLNIFVHLFYFINVAWHLRLRQYYPGQEIINEHNDPNLAETPHYKEKQTILPNPIIVDHVDGKKPHTPVKRTHDGKIKKDKKDPLKSPMINEQNSPKEVSIKSDEAKIDMRKLIIEHKSHKKSSNSSGSRSKKSTKHLASSTSSSSSSPSSSLSPRSSKANKNQKEKHKLSSNSSSNDLHHRSHSSSKKSSHSDKHRENRKSSTSSSLNHSSSVEKQKLPMEIPLKKVDESKDQLSSNTQPTEIAKQIEETNSNDHGQLSSPIQVSSSHSNIPVMPPASAQAPAPAPLPISAPAPPPDAPTIPAPQNPAAVAHPIEAIQTTPCDTEKQLQHPIQPPLPTTIPPVSPPPPPPPPLEDDENQSRSDTMPDSSTQQSPAQPPVKVRKLNNGDKSTTDKNSDILGSIMASMDSPRNPSNF